MGGMPLLSAESVKIKFTAAVNLPFYLIKAVKQRTVQKRHTLHYRLERTAVAILKLLFIAVQCRYMALVALALECMYELSFLWLAVERREKEVLKDGAVVVVLLHRIRFEVLEHILQALAVEEDIRHELPLADEPREHKARDHADKRLVVVFAIVLVVVEVVGEADIGLGGHGPSIPVEELGVEFLGELLHRKDILKLRKCLDWRNKATLDDVVGGLGLDVEALAFRLAEFELALLDLARHERETEESILVVEEEQSLRGQAAHALRTFGDGVLEELLRVVELDETAGSLGQVLAHLDGRDKNGLVRIVALA